MISGIIDSRAVVLRQNYMKHPDFHSIHPADSPEYQKDYRKHIKEKHPDLYKIRNRWTIKNWIVYIERRYGLSNGDFEKLLVRQDNICPICKLSVFRGRGKKPQVDHDHKTGIIRGLLCSHCNLALGHLGEDIIRLQNAIIYLSDGGSNGK